MGHCLEVHAARKAQITIESEPQHLCSVYISRKGFNVVLVSFVNFNEALNEEKRAAICIAAASNCQKYRVVARTRFELVSPP